jgi:phosphoglycerate dehydrogenase-like enzyme
MKALLHFAASTRLRDKLSKITEPRIVVVNETDDESFAREIATTDVLLHTLKPVTAAMIAAAPKLKLIQKIGVGVNTIDRQAASRAGIAVANMPGTNTQAVVEHTLALMLATLRRVAAFDAAMRRGDGWRIPPDSIEALGELNGSTVGLVGYGAIPQRLTPILQALGADVRFWNRTPRPNAAATPMPLDELLAVSDIISLHVPLTSDTQHLLDRRAIEQMKPGAIVINTARGQLIDQTVLTEFLRDGRLAGAGLDVFENEPVSDRNLELLSCPTVVMTPHIAWLTPETIERSLVVALENCRRLKDGEPLLHQIPYDPATAI